MYTVKKKLEYIQIWVYTQKNVEGNAQNINVYHLKYQQ